MNADTQYNEQTAKKVTKMLSKLSLHEAIFMRRSTCWY
jgi:hypothetical protein